MIIDSKKTNRLLIYRVEDAGNSADGYTDYFLQEMKNHVSDIIIVNNSVHEQVSTDTLQQYDEVVFADDTLIGPVYPLPEMFETMDSRDIDFWQIIHNHANFLAVRKPVLQGMQIPENRNNLLQAVKAGGFTRDVYIDIKDDDTYTDDPFMFNPLQLVRDKKCPFISKNVFLSGYSDLMESCTGEIAPLIFKYLRNNTCYDTNLIIKHLLGTQNQLDISRVMAMHHILPSDTLIGKTPETRKYKAALVFHAYYADQFECLRQYIMSLPDDMDVIFTTDSVEKKEKLLSVYKDAENRNIEVIIAENRGRSESALLVAAKDLVYDYDYICFAHDKKSTKYVAHNITGKSFADKCYDNLLPGKCFVENILSTFENNPLLGMLAPPPPIHAEYFRVAAQKDWQDNYRTTKQLAERLNLNVDIDYNKAPIAPLGGMLWFRTRAMKKLFDYNWDYGDFPEEPVYADGTLLHAIERIYPLVVQDAGFYPARVCSDIYAAIEISNLSYYLYEYTKTSVCLHDITTHAECVQGVLAELEKCRKLEEQARELVPRAQALQQRVHDLENSTSWKVTKPLRAIIDLVKGKAEHP